ncbi:MAG: caspase family protein [candidate division Zixibacteria bacterium]|nr:caspase family protein [candidate division Zixibacteria bacterium]
MKRVLLFAAVLLTLIMMFGCSKTPQINGPSDSTNLGQLVQRPEFIDTRPPSAIALATVKPTADYTPIAYKPPQPPPDTGADPNPNPAHKYAYIVGISDYEGTANDLQFCDDDAQDMKSYFQSQGFTIRMDLDRNATATAVEAGLNWLVSVAVPGDEVAFAYSGHGAKAQGYGSSLISTDLYYLTHGWVMQKFNAVNCSKKHISLDACVIGGFLTDCVNGTMMALASNSTYSYDAPDLNNGAWTYYWIEAVEDQGKIYAEDAATYAEAGMKAWAALYHLRVSPTHSDKYTGMFDI